ncbi:MAG: PEP-CTERM sorting domain-containing protein [Planctomycetota bacterium]
MYKSFCGACFACLVVTWAAPVAEAQLRVVTYNTNTFQDGFLDGVERLARPGVDIALQGIGEELVNGIARPADIILLQEQQRPSTTTQDLVDRLNAIYGEGFYARGFEVGATTGGSGFGQLDGSEIRQAVIYRTDSVQLLAEDSFGNISGPTQPRETLFYQFRPVGYGADADLFIFNSHFEAGDGTGFGGDLFARENEATDIRNYITANNLGNANVISAGDFNVDSNFELSGTNNFGGRSSLQILTDGTDAGGRLIDPLFPNGGNVTFRNNFGLADQLTQSPSDGAGPLAGGGIDDRFDFILTSDELLDNEGVALIADSYRVFGNNGSTFNDQINDGNTISINGLTSFTTAQVLNALESGSDHLPVVADFQLPAVLEALLADAVPATVDRDEVVSLELSIRNAAEVAVAVGADELDYAFTTSGDLFGSGSGTDAALGGSISELVGLDTSTLGLRSGLITVTSDSFGVANGFVEIPVTFEVVPEPTSLALLGLGGVMVFRRSRASRATG